MLWGEGTIVLMGLSLIAPVYIWCELDMPIEYTFSCVKEEMWRVVHAVIQKASLLAACDLTNLCVLFSFGPTSVSSLFVQSLKTPVCFLLYLNWKLCFHYKQWLLPQEVPHSDEIYIFGNYNIYISILLSTPLLLVTEFDLY